MAAIPVTFQGILFFSDLGVGGAPMPGGQPPMAGQGPGFPTNPIAPGGSPPGMWGPINIPGQGLPGNQPYPGQGLPWGPGRPDQGLPGNQPIAGWGPGFPTNPIAPGGGGGGGGQPPTAGWGPGFPSNPIVIPPEGWPEQPPQDNQSVLVLYVPGLGYKAVVIDNPPGMNTKPQEPSEPK